jgi:hypothetical protein
LTKSEEDGYYRVDYSKIDVDFGKLWFGVHWGEDDWNCDMKWDASRLISIMIVETKV